MTDDNRCPAVDETWQVVVGDIIYEGVVTKVEMWDSPERAKVWARWTENGLFVCGEREAFATWHKNNDNEVEHKWKLIKEAKQEITTFDSMMTKALRSDAWSGIDGRFKKG